MHHGTQKMSRNLKVKFEFKEPVRIEKDGNNENAQRFQKVKIIPENIGVWCFESPLNKSTNAIVQSIPQTQPHIGPFPDSRYVFNKFQA